VSKNFDGRVTKDGDRSLMPISGQPDQFADCKAVPQTVPEKDNQSGLTGIETDDSERSDEFAPF
jgi:hypothetical protein